MVRRDPREIFAENLNRFAKNKGKNPTDVARDLALPNQTVRDWFLGNNYPRPISVQKLADYFNVEISDITEEPLDPTKMRSEFNVIQVPVVGSIKAGPNGIAEENYNGFSSVDRDKIESDFDYYWLKVYGDSMIGDGILEGDLALIKQTPEFENRDICAVIVDGEEGTLKHVEKHDNTVVLTGSNPNYSPRIFVNEDCNLITIAGKLVQIKREYN